MDTTITPQLAAEGVARDLVRLVQQARRDAGFDVSDHIALTVVAPAEVLDAVRDHLDLVAGETLSDSVDTVDSADGAVGGYAGTVGAEVPGDGDGDQTVVALIVFDEVTPDHNGWPGRPGHNRHRTDPATVVVTPAPRCHVNDVDEV